MLRSRNCIYSTDMRREKESNNYPWKRSYNFSYKLQYLTLEDLIFINYNTEVMYYPLDT